MKITTNLDTIIKTTLLQQNYKKNNNFKILTTNIHPIINETFKSIYNDLNKNKTLVQFISILTFLGSLEYDLFTYFSVCKELSDLAIIQDTTLT